MIRKAQQRFFFSLSLLTFVKTPLYYYVLSRKEEATKVLKRKRQKPSFKASSRQRSTRYNAYYGSRRAILLEADGEVAETYEYITCVFISFLLVFLSLFRQ